ncbi:hypothetical protein AVDCRST_MAG92-201, partial [uncultured Coleofasciculus sp.]
SRKNQGFRFYTLKEQENTSPYRKGLHFLDSKAKQEFPIFFKMWAV